MTARSHKGQWAGACQRLLSLRGRSESSPRYLPSDLASEFDGILDDFEALGFDIGEFRILPHELQRFASYVVVAPGKHRAPSAKGGYFLNRSLLNGRIDSALTHVGGVDPARKPSAPKRR